MNYYPKRKVGKLRFYMESDHPDIKVCLNVGRTTNYKGSMRLLIPQSDFDKLKDDGNIIARHRHDAPRLASGITISDLLKEYSWNVRKKMDEVAWNKRCNLTQAEFNAILNECREDLFITLSIWRSNLEWNRRLGRAHDEGRVESFMRKMRPYYWQPVINWEEVDNEN